MFKNRIQAAQLLAKQLHAYKNKDAVVLAIPRGGIILGEVISRELNAELDIIVPRKMGAPDNPELAIGAVTEDGTLILNDNVINLLMIKKEYIAAEAKKQIREIKRRIEEYRGSKPYPEIKNKTVIIVDDGIATGATAKAAISSIKKKNPKEIILAAPVGSADIVAHLGKDAKVICLEKPLFLQSIGEFYEDFSQVSDNDVKKILQSF